MSVILARKILRPNPLVCIGVGEPDCLQTLEKTHGEIQNSAEESHWGISRKSVCAAGVVFSSELPPSHHSHHRHLLQSLDRLRPTKPVWSSSSCLPPPPLPATGRALFHVMVWSCLPDYWLGHCRNAEHSAYCTGQTSHLRDYTGHLPEIINIISLTICIG